jgi:hypothetical protein
MLAAHDLSVAESEGLHKGVTCSISEARISGTTSHQGHLTLR